MSSFYSQRQPLHVSNLERNPSYRAMNQNSKVYLQGAYPVSRTTQGMKLNLNLSQNHFRTLKFLYEPYSHGQNLWAWIGPLRAFPVVLVSLKKNKYVRSMLQNNLGINVPGWGQAGQDHFGWAPRHHETGPGCGGSPCLAHKQPPPFLSS